MDAAYDGLKSTINVMVKMTDGLPWPLKAAPQTFLYVLRLFEVSVTGFSLETGTERLTPEFRAVKVFAQRSHLFFMLFRTCGRS